MKNIFHHYLEYLKIWNSIYFLDFPLDVLIESFSFNAGTFLYHKKKQKEQKPKQFKQIPRNCQ